jgi:hypothetical protein
MKEPVNDLPVDEWEHGEFVHCYAITVPVTKSVAHTVRTLKRAVCKSFEHIIIVSEDEPHLHCHALVGGSVTEADLGSGLIDHIQKMTMAAMAIADMKVWAQRSYRV